MIRNLRQSEEKLAKTVKVLQGQVDSLTVDKDEKANTIAQLGQENGELASKIVGLMSRITTLQADNARIMASSKMNQETIARQNTTITELQKKDGQQKCTMQNLNDKVRTLEGEKVSTAKALNAASFKSRLMQPREDALKTQYGRTIESLHCRIRALESQVEADCMLKEQQRDTLLGFKGDLKHRGCVIDELHDRISLLQGQISTANTLLTNAQTNTVPAARSETAATGTEENPSAAIISMPALNEFLVSIPLLKLFGHDSRAKNKLIKGPATDIPKYPECIYRSKCCSLHHSSKARTRVPARTKHSTSRASKDLS